MNFITRMSCRLVAALMVCGWCVSESQAQPSWNDLGAGSLPQMRGGSSGRVGVIAVEPGTDKVIYIGTPGGGVWKTTDSGTTWSPLTDAMPCNSIGSIAIDPKDPKTIYVGTGEANLFEHCFYGLGVYRSNDGGGTWVQLPRANGQHVETTFDGRCIGRIVVDPNDSSHVLAVVSQASKWIQYGKGHKYGQTGAVGLFQSHDFGETWTQSTVPSQLTFQGRDVIHVSGSRFLVSTDAGLFVSDDGGNNWTAVPNAPYGRIALAVAPLDPSIVYSVDSSFSVRQSQNSGSTWGIAQLPTPCLAGFAQAITVDRANSNVVYVGCVDIWKVTFPSGTAPSVNLMPPDFMMHEDQHAFAWDFSGHLLVGNDGGITRSTYLGSIPDAPASDSWDHLDAASLGITQVVAGISPHPSDPNVIYAGTQDNSDMRSVDETRVWDTPPMPLIAGEQPPFEQPGDGGYTLIDPGAPSNILAGTPGSVIWVSVDGGASFIRRSATGPIGSVLGAPFVVDPTPVAPGQMAQVVQGSGRLCHFVYNGTSAHYDLIGGTNGGILPVDCRARCVAVAPANTGGVQQYVYVAAGHFDHLHDETPPDTRSQDYSVLLSSVDGGATLILPSDSSNAELRSNGFMSWNHGTREIAFDPVEPNVAFAVSAMWGDTTPPRARFWRTTDGGNSWEAADGNSPGLQGSLPVCPINAVAVLSAPSLLRKVLVGTDQGVYLTNDDGKHWAKYGLGMPNTFVYDLVIDLKHNRLLASTMGRGIWSIQLPCVADIDDGTLTGTPDGIVDMRDYIAFFHWLATGEHSTDMNRDGDNGTDADIALFMQHYLSGC